jgi:hypothetical protein
MMNASISHSSYSLSTYCACTRALYVLMKIFARCNYRFGLHKNALPLAVEILL